MSEIQCSKCSGTMTQGFIVDSTYGANKVSSWHEGKPQSSWLTNTKIEKSKMHKVVTYRCSGCGFLESYAPHLP